MIKDSINLRENRNPYLSAYLLLHEYDIENTRVENGRVVFGFVDGPELRQAEQDFFRRETLVEPLTWLDRIRELRSMTDELVRREVFDQTF